MYRILRHPAFESIGLFLARKINLCFNYKHTLPDKILWIKVPKIWRSAETFVRRKILSAELFLPAYFLFNKKPSKKRKSSRIKCFAQTFLKQNRRTKVPKISEGSENIVRRKFLSAELFVRRIFVRQGFIQTMICKTNVMGTIIVM